MTQIRGAVLERIGSPRPYAQSRPISVGEVELAPPGAEELQVRIEAEPRSKVLFEITDLEGGLVKLTVVHDGFEPGSEVLETISQGWPHILSNLKTLLETGQTLTASATDEAAAA